MFSKYALALLGSGALLSTPALASAGEGPVILANFSIIEDAGDASAWDGGQDADKDDSDYDTDDDNDDRDDRDNADDEDDGGEEDPELGQGV